MGRDPYGKILGFLLLILEVGQAGRLFDVRGYVWPKILTAVVSGQHVRSLPAPLPWAAGTLAVFGGPTNSGRYVYGFGGPRKNGRCVYGFHRPKKRRPIRLRFSKQCPPLSTVKVGVVDYLFCVWRDVWTKIRTAVVYDRHVRKS